MLINALLSLSCVIQAGSGSLTIIPGIIESPRYEHASVMIQMREDELMDIRVNGPWDRNWSYRDHGFALHAERSAGRWIWTLARIWRGKHWYWRTAADCCGLRYPMHLH